MDWLQEHIQIIIVVASAIAYWINQRRREKQGLPADYDGDGTPDTKPTPTSFDPATMEMDEAERTRRLMEEMRRKRAERAANPEAPLAPAAPPVVIAPSRRLDAPPPVFQDPLAEMMKDLARRYTQQPESEAPTIDPEILARQRDLEERMRRLDAEREAAIKMAREMRSVTVSQSSSYSQENATTGLVGSLRDTASLRKAILLNEILGKPVALR